METRLDTGVIYKSEKTDEGFLRVWMSVSKVGDLEYRTDSGDRQIETVTKETLFDADSLDTVWGKPITLIHPKSGLLTTQTARGEERGMTQLFRDDNHPDLLTVLGVITDQETIDAIEDGMTEVSAGYRCDVSEVEGKRYQKNRRYNHFAIVPRGRAGADVKVHVDCLRCDAAVTAKDLNVGKPDAQPIGEQGSKNLDEGIPMAQIKLDGADYELDATIVAAIRADQKAGQKAIEKLQTKLDESEQAIAELTEEKKKIEGDLDKAAGEIEGLQTQLEEKTDSAETISTEVQARLDAWSEVLPSLQSVDGDFKADSALSVADIKRLYLTEVRGKENLDSYSAERIDGMYDALRPDEKQDAKAKTQAHLDSLNQERSDRRGVSTLEEARRKSIERKQKAYMGGEK